MCSAALPVMLLMLEGVTTMAIIQRHWILILTCQNKIRHFTFNHRILFKRGV